ncbi:MAG: H-NS histone family protein [Magnetococcales bacterium]|nr:H-NS histone family protein [Magnetococcales bacterium]
MKSSEVQVIKKSFRKTGSKVDKKQTSSPVKGQNNNDNNNSEDTIMISYQQIAEAFDHIKLEELIALQKKLGATITAKQAAKQKEIYGQMMELARVAGFDSVQEFADSQETGKRRSLKGTKVPPKYHNPDNHMQTWSGRGRQPGWLNDLIEGGKTLEDCLIMS